MRRTVFVSLFDYRSSLATDIDVTVVSVSNSDLTRSPLPTTSAKLKPAPSGSALR